MFLHNSPDFTSMMDYFNIPHLVNTFIKSHFQKHECRHNQNKGGKSALKQLVVGT